MLNIEISCFECNSTEDIHQHHVVPRVMGGTKTLPLCSGCHGKVHSRDMTSTSRLIKKALAERKASGVKLGRKLSDISPDELCYLRFGQGISIRNLAKHYGRSPSTIMYHLKLLSLKEIK